MDGLVFSQNNLELDFEQSKISLDTGITLVANRLLFLKACAEKVRPRPGSNFFPFPRLTSLKQTVEVKWTKHCRKIWKHSETRSWGRSAQKMLLLFYSW